VRYAVVTFGCRVNQADSLGVEAALTSAGAEPAAVDRADVVLVNTRQAIRRIHRENPAARIVVTGCFATRAPEELRALGGVTAVMPNAAKPELAGLLLPMLSLDADRHEGPCGRPPGPGLMGRTAWTLRVQTGCDETCSYCIIPATRGASCSRTLDDVLAELTGVLEAGYREVALTGVHLGAWGRDLPAPGRLVGLLAAISRLPGAFRVRVSSLEPMDCTSEVLDVVSGHPSRFAAHLHLPLQHASDPILRAMRRPYSAAAYRDLVHDVRRRMPDAAIGTDVIVGFPGESDADAEVLAAFLEDSPLTHLHVFPYSERPGTDAALLPAKVHGSVVKARAQRLRAVSAGLSARFRASQAGRVRRGLAIEDGRTAITDNYIRVPLAQGVARNEWVDVVVPGFDPVTTSAPAPAAAS
jgi:threonylcarbamoyladenosine tRNA methylthiotransferase MtaB